MNQALCVCLTTPTLFKNPFCVSLEVFFQAGSSQRVDCLTSMRNKQVSFPETNRLIASLEIEPIVSKLAIINPNTASGQSVVTRSVVWLVPALGGLGVKF